MLEMMRPITTKTNFVLVALSLPRVHLNFSLVRKSGVILKEGTLTLWLTWSISKMKQSSHKPFAI